MENEVFTVIVTVGDDESRRIYQIAAEDETAAKRIARKHVAQMIDTTIGDRFAIVEFDDAFLDGDWRGVANV